MIQLFIVLHLTCHVGSYGVTCYSTQVNTLRLKHKLNRPYSIYLHPRDGRLGWSRWTVIYRDGLPAHRWSPIQVL